MAYIRQEIRGTTGQDIAKMNENFMGIYEKVFGDINFSDTDTALQNSILTQWIPFQGDGNLDSNYPVYVRFFVPPNVKQVKSAKLHAIAEKYRMDSSVTSGGGGVAGGSVTLSVASGGGYTNTLSQGTQTSYVRKWGSPPHEYVAPTQAFNKNGTIEINAGGLVNNPGTNSLGLGTLNTTIGSTSTYVADLLRLQHSHEIPSHSHSISIEPHTHSGEASVDIPDHTHSISEGIKVSTSKIADCSIAINDTYVGWVGENKQVQNDIDIAPYIKVGEWNIIRVRTDSGLARINIYGTIEALMKLK